MGAKRLTDALAAHIQVEASVTFTVVAAWGGNAAPIQAQVAVCLAYVCDVLGLDDCREEKLGGHLRTDGQR